MRLFLLLFFLSSVCFANGKININKASESQMHHVVKGLGEKRIKAIIKYRKEHGKFKTLHDLAKVKGLSKRFVRRHYGDLQRHFTVD